MKRSMETTCIQGGWQPKNGRAENSADLPEHDL